MPDHATEVTSVPAPGTLLVRGAMAVIGPAAADVSGCALPDVRGLTASGDARLAWMAPDELLVMLPRSHLAEVRAELDQRLATQHALVQDVSDMRAHIAIRGPGAREALAKLAPVDLHPDHLGPGNVRRTRLAQVPAAFWLEAETEIRVLVFRSVLDYALEVLRQAAAPEAAVGLSWSTSEDASPSEASSA